MFALRDCRRISSGLFWIWAWSMISLLGLIFFFFSLKEFVAFIHGWTFAFLVLLYIFGSFTLYLLYRLFRPSLWMFIVMIEANELANVHFFFVMSLLFYFLLVNCIEDLTIDSNVFLASVSINAVILTRPWNHIHWNLCQIYPHHFGRLLVSGNMSNLLNFELQSS